MIELGPVIVPGGIVTATGDLYLDPLMLSDDEKHIIVKCLALDTKTPASRNWFNWGRAEGNKRAQLLQSMAQKDLIECFVDGAHSITRKRIKVKKKIGRRTFKGSRIVHSADKGAMDLCCRVTRFGLESFKRTIHAGDIQR